MKLDEKSSHNNRCGAGGPKQASVGRVRDGDLLVPGYDAAVAHGLLLQRLAASSGRDLHPSLLLPLLLLVSYEQCSIFGTK